MQRIGVVFGLVFAIAASVGAANAQTAEERRLAEHRADGHTHVAPPRGYQLVWDDDRLNPHRGERKATGRAQMNEIWTNDVPMRLVRP